MKFLKNLNIKKIDNLISLAVFGSYGTRCWRDGDSDIDIFVLMAKREDIMDEISLEEILVPILKDFFNYENIHLTFLSIIDYDSRLARQYLDSNDKLIVDELKEIDFRLYVNKYLRENEWIIRKTSEDNRFLEDTKVAEYYRYKKESINLKFNSAKDTLKLMQGAIKEYKA